MAATLERQPHDAAPAPVPTLRTVAAISAAALLVVGQLYATLPLLGDLGKDFGVPGGRPRGPRRSSGSPTR